MLKIKQIEELQNLLDSKLDLANILQSIDVITYPDWTGASDDYIPTQLAIKDFLEYNYSSGNNLDIGLPTDGDYSDGYHNFWDAQVSIADAFDNINESLLDIALDPAGNLSGDLVSPALFTGKLANALPNLIQWTPDGILPGDTITNIIDSSNIILEQPDLLTTFNAGRKFNYPDNLVGSVYAWKVSGDIVFPGTPTSTRNLSSLTGGVGTTGIIEITDISTYNDVHIKANARIVETALAEGYNQYKISADNASETNTFKVYYTGLTFPDPSFSINPVITESTPILKRLSGIDYYGVGSTFNISYTVDNLYYPVYIVGNQNTISSDYFNTIGVNYAGIPNYNSQLVVSQALTLVSNQSSDQSLGECIVTLYKPNKTDVTYNLSIGSRYINTYSTISTNQIEYFYDENKRYNSYLIQNWNSNNIFTNTEGQLQVQNGILIDPRFTGNYPFYTATTNYYRRYFSGFVTDIDRGTLTFDKSATLGEPTKWLNVGGGKFQVSLRVQRGAIWSQYDLALGLGLNPGDGGIGIKDIANSSENIIKWALPYGEESISPGDTVIIDIKFENAISTDFISQINMDWNW